MNKISIGYFADGPWAHEAFKRLIADNSITISFICPRFDSSDFILYGFAEEYKIPFIKHPNINSEEFIRLISVYQCDLFVSMSFNQIFKNRIINIPKLKTINCHAGKLPYYRGRNILNWVLINDDSEFGITVHYIDEGIDTGDIILQKTYPITDDDNYKTLLNKAYIGCAEVLYEAVSHIQKGTQRRIDQKTIHPTGFYCTQRIKGDEKINWNTTSREVFNFIRALCSPGPMARAFLDKREIKINKAVYVKEAPKHKGIPGAIINTDDHCFSVKTSDTYITITEWTFDGKIRLGDRLDLIT
jgi:methionyl-tRNA formyltransferase